MLLIIDQKANVIFFRKTGCLFVFVLPNPLYQIACYAYVERAVLFAGKHVNAGLFVHAAERVFPPTWE